MTFEEWFAGDVDPIWGVPNVDLPTEKAEAYARKVWAAATNAAACSRIEGNMNTDAEHDLKQIGAHGTVTVNQIDGITVQGFEFDNCTCREGAILACAWAIQELSREMKKMIERPGDGRIGMA